MRGNKLVDNSRRTCPICHLRCDDNGIKLLTNNRACHEKCVMDIWERVVTINDRANKLAVAEFQKNHLLDSLNKESKEVDAIISRNKANAGLIARFISSNYAKDLEVLKTKKTNISMKIEQLRIEQRDFSASNQTQSNEMRKEAEAIYVIVKPLFDFWPVYPPDWEDRKFRKKDSRARKCEGCGTKHGPFHIHHKSPLSQGGDHKNSNLALLCENCHKGQHGVQKFSEGRNIKASEKTIKNTNLIEKAIKAKKTVEFKYKKFDGEVSHRTIDPHEMILFKNSKCVRGFCHLRNEDRSFKISRISLLKILEH
jgi:5-methylcytosine-specific restriction endonuclease McrA